MTAAALSEEQTEAVWAAVRKLRRDARPGMAEILELAMVEDTITEADRCRAHVYADYCDRSGMRERSAAIKALLRE